MNTSVQVMYEKIVMSQTEGSQLVEECNTVELEVHTSCRCGCQQTKCNELQVKRYIFVNIIINTTFVRELCI